MTKINPALVLETDKVILRPLHPDDVQKFLPLTQDESLWKYFTMLLNDEKALRDWVELALQERDEDTRIPFTIIKKETGNVCGSTSFGNISYSDQRLEIGWSWLGRRFQGTEINFHAKYSLLRYVFDELGWERVEMKTDNLNERAKQGLRKIGAKEEGVFRSHMKMPWNRRRDSVYFSIVRAEWSDLKKSVFRGF